MSPRTPGEGEQSKPVVIDASVLLAFYLPAEPYKGQALELLAQATAGQIDLLAPRLARYEALNVLALAARGIRGEQDLSLEDAEEIAAAIAALPWEERDIDGLERRILEIAQEYERSAYDASYLAVAEAADAPFITGDRRLYNALSESFDRISHVADWGA